MRIALIIGGNRWFCPFVEIYADILKAQHIDFDVLYWNKTNTEKSEFSYDLFAKDTDSLFRKVINYFRYSLHLRKLIKKNRYDRLIVFNAVCGIFLFPFLKSHFRKKFIFDYRDLSIEQYVFFKPIFKKLLSISSYNVISSPGFKECLPDGFDYILSHNFNIDIVRWAITQSSLVTKNNSEIIDILTIGGIRDFSSNAEVIDAIANNPEFQMRFIGQGLASESLKTYCKQRKVKNVVFHGYYKKKDEAGFIGSSSFLNIYYPTIISHSTALSNRFYNALIYKKPMIVTADSIQGDFVKKYNLGVVLKDCANLDEKLKTYWQNIDYSEFCKQANILLSQFVDDYNYFCDKVIKFVK